MKKITKTLLLDQLEARIEQHLKIVTSAFQNLNEAELLKQATHGGWSIAQCLEHLNSYGRYYLPAIQKGISTSKDTAAPTFKSSWLGAYFTRLMEPGTQSKAMKSPREYKPRPDLDASKVIAEFMEQQEFLLSLLRRAATKDIGKIRIPISIARWIRLKLGDVFGFIVAHNERHIQQAKRNL